MPFADQRRAITGCCSRSDSSGVLAKFGNARGHQLPVSSEAREKTHIRHCENESAELPSLASRSSAGVASSPP